MGGLQAAREIARRRPELRILMLSMHDNEQYFLEALRAGAGGYVLKSVADHDLIGACRAAMRGEPFVLPGHRARCSRSTHSTRRGGAELARLTPRESRDPRPDRRGPHRRRRSPRCS